MATNYITIQFALLKWLYLASCDKMDCSVKSREQGARSRERGAESVEQGAWSMERGAWSVGHGDRSPDIRILWCENFSPAHIAPAARHEQNAPNGFKQGETFILLVSLTLPVRVSTSFRPGYWSQLLGAGSRNLNI